MAAAAKSKLTDIERQVLFIVYYGELKSYLSYYIYWHNLWRLLPDNAAKPLVEPAIFLGLVYQFVRAEGKDRYTLQAFAELSLTYAADANKNFKRFTKENLFGVRPEDFFENDRWFVLYIMNTLRELPVELRGVIARLPQDMRSDKGQELAEGIASAIEERLACTGNILRMN